MNLLAPVATYSMQTARWLSNTIQVRSLTSQIHMTYEITLLNNFSLVTPNLGMSPIYSSYLFMT